MYGGQYWKWDRLFNLKNFQHAPCWLSVSRESWSTAIYFSSLYLAFPFLNKKNSQLRVWLLYVYYGCIPICVLFRHSLLRCLLLSTHGRTYRFWDVSCSVSLPMSMELLPRASLDNSRLSKQKYRPNVELYFGNTYNTVQILFSVIFQQQGRKQE